MTAANILLEAHLVDREGTLQFADEPAGIPCYILRLRGVIVGEDNGGDTVEINVAMPPEAAAAIGHDLLPKLITKEQS